MQTICLKLSHYFTIHLGRYYVQAPWQARDCSVINDTGLLHTGGHCPVWRHFPCTYQVTLIETPKKRLLSRNSEWTSLY